MAYKIDSKSSVNEMIGLNITGNVMPMNWLKHIQHSNGKPYLLACTILSDIVYWYRPVEMRDERTGQPLGYKKKFKADKLQRSYGAIAEQYGFTKREVKAAMTHLESIGLVDRDFRTFIVKGIKLGNVLFIGLNVERLKEITYNDTINTDTTDSEPTAEDTPLSHPDTPPYDVSTSEGTRSNVIGVTLKRHTNTETSQRVPNTQDAPGAAVCDSPPSCDVDEDDTRNAIETLAVRFSKLTDIPIPTNGKRYNQKWARPCREILQMCNDDMQVALLLIERTVGDMKQRGINYKAPSSLVNIARRLYEQTANIGSKAGLADETILESVWATYQSIRSNAKKVHECDDRIVATIKQIGMPNFTALKAKDKPTFDKRILSTYRGMEVAL